MRQKFEFAVETVSAVERYTPPHVQRYSSIPRRDYTHVPCYLSLVQDVAEFLVAVGGE